MRRLLIALLASVVVLASCGGEEEPRADGGGGPGSESLIVQPATYDLAAGAEERFIAGLLTPDQLFVSWGSVDMSFTYLGTEAEPSEEPGPEATAEFLHIDGEHPTGEAPSEPAIGPPSEGRGVYATHTTFDKAGFWEVEVGATIEGERVTGTGAFEVAEEHLYPAVGEKAPRSKNLIIGSEDAPTEAIDSRATGGSPVPDRSLHQITVNESIERGEPALVVISTPVYCVSRFCGPVTDMIEELAAEQPKSINFIHIEVWRNFQGQVVNRAAADWVYRGQDLTEPWVFLIDDKGKIVARWDNVATRAEIEPELAKLSS